MKTIAYIYSDPLLESLTTEITWSRSIDLLYQDLGSREQLKQLLVDCQSEPPQYLLLRRLTELGDSVTEISNYLDRLEGFGIEIIATEGDYTSSGFKNLEPSQLRQQLDQLWQEIQEIKQRDRLKQGHARNRLQILPPPGKAPYGYRRGQDKYIIDKSTAPVVKDFFERFLLFGSLRGAVKYLEKRYGKKIAPSTGRNWLTNPVYRGDLQYQNRDLIPNTHTAILSREEAAQIDRLLRRNSRLPPRTASAPRSLAGSIVCQQCQLPLTISRVTQKNQNQEYLYLRCHGCPRQPKCKAIPYSEVLERTINKICVELPIAVAALDLPSVVNTQQSLKESIKDKQAILSEIPQLVDRGIFDRETAALREYKLRTEIAQIESQLAQLPPANLQTIAEVVSLPQFWWDLSEAERRFYFREFIKQIDIIRLDRSQAWDLNLIFIF
jgi:DNA invertase Pin-like site-specific DNA recombinase